MIRITATSVREFMRAILPTEPHCPKGPVIFRGQADATWGIIPSLWRADAWTPLGGAESHGLKVVGAIVEDSDAAKIVVVRATLLFTFRQVVHRLGIPLDLSDKDNDDTAEALARHLGLPASLIDWTRSPFVAAYFAATDAVRQGLKGGHLAVYVMGHNFRLNAHGLRNTSQAYVGGFGNPNLVAQEGLLIRVNGPPLDLLTDIQIRDERLGEPPSGPRAQMNAQLAQILLPHAYAADLLRVLRDQGVHAGSMFPGHRGVLELVHEVFRCPDVRDLHVDTSWANKTQG